MTTRTGPQARSIIVAVVLGQVAPSLSTARLITDQVTSTGRTFSTSIIQREVIHAQGHRGSNQNSAALRSDMGLTSCHPVAVTILERCTAAMRDRMVRRPQARPPDRRAHARTAPQGDPVPGTNLTREEAATRAALVTVDRHDVELDVTTGPETFSTRSTVHFPAPSPAPRPSSTSSAAPSSRSPSTAPTSTRPSDYADSRVRLPGPGRRERRASSSPTGRYMNTGEGLHRFVDPVDDEVYLYTQFEVPDSRRMFAVFEQPDLKASFTLHGDRAGALGGRVQLPHPAARARPARAPATLGVRAHPRDLVLHHRAHRRPVRVVRDEVTQPRAARCPLGVFCRKSLMQYLDADNIFELTRQGFEFFEAQFDCPYPFEKYDQLFVPEFNAGAMENAGAVTILEGYVFRCKVTEAQVERRAITVLHELAHMWFGDLVTMRWWNDLWLNESFAEWVSHLPGREHRVRPRLDHLRLRGEVLGLPPGPAAHHAPDLRRDQRPPGRRGELRRHHLRQGRLGAPAARRLGRPEPFCPGCARTSQARLGQHRARRPARRTRGHRGRDLRAGPSSGWRPPASTRCARRSRSTTGAGSPPSPSCRPAPPGATTLRPHRLAIGSLQLRDGALERTHRVELDVDGERTEVPELVGRAQPDLVLLNDDDLAYAKIRLDERSLATALAHPRGFTTSLPHSLVLASPWDMTRDAEMGARYFVDVVLDTLPGESDSTLLRTLISQLQTAVHTYSAPEHRAALTSSTRDRLWALARSAEPGSDAQLQLVSATAALTGTDASGDTAHLRALLDGTEVLDGLTVDFEMRWTLLTALVAAGARRCRRDRRRALSRGHRHRARAGRPGPSRAPDPRGQGARLGSGRRGQRAAQRHRRVGGAGLHPPGHLARPAATVRRALPRDARHRREPRFARHGRVGRPGLLPPPHRRRRPARPHPGVAGRQPARPGGPAPAGRGEPRPGGAGPGGPGA